MLLSTEYDRELVSSLKDATKTKSNHSDIFGVVFSLNFLVGRAVSREAQGKQGCMVDTPISPPKTHRQ